MVYESCDPAYENPEFHTETLADLNVMPKDEALEKDQLEDYFYRIKDKITEYIGNLKDEELFSNPDNCNMSRFCLILGQFRHWHRHMGIIYGFIVEDTGKWPYVLNMEGKYPEKAMPNFFK